MKRCIKRLRFDIGSSHAWLEFWKGISHSAGLSERKYLQPLDKQNRPDSQSYLDGDGRGKWLRGNIRGYIRAISITSTSSQ